MTVYDPTLPAGASLGKSFEYGFDVFDGPALEALTAAANDARWLPVRRAFNINPAMTPITQDAQTYDDKGSPNADVSAWSFVLNASALVNRSATTGEVVPELRVLQQRYGDKSGDDAVVGVRWYHKPADGSAPDPNEAFHGLATVGIVRANVGPNGANESWNLTLTGKGYARRIANPFTGWADDTATPVVTGVAPEGEGTGELVTITGSGFVGATAVTFDTIAASDFTVVSSSTIVAVLPADTAGDVPVVVTTVDGTSAPYTYTRAA
jgi:hypothetical protein